MLLFLLFCIASILTYSYSRRKNSYFKNAGVKTLPPLPLVGNLGRVTMKKASFLDVIKEGYDTFEEQRYFGLYQYMIPTLVPKDPELIRRIMSQDFDAFPNRGIHIDEESDPLFSRNLIMLRGRKWKDIRSMITPAFTWSKLKQMIPFILECTRDTVAYIDQCIDKSRDGWMEVDTSDVTLAYTNDVIASCAFGFRVNTHEERNNQIYIMGQSAVIQHVSQIIKFFGYENFPRIMKLLKIKIIDSESANLFRRVFSSTLKMRSNNNNIRADFVQSLLEARKGLFKVDSDSDSNEQAATKLNNTETSKLNINKEYNDDDLIAQAVLFYVAGFDTTAHLSDFILYELACNEHVQERLFEEICDVHDPYNVQDIKYLDMLVSEVLRIWPPIASVDRRSAVCYDFGPTEYNGDKHFIGKPDLHIWLPIYSLHRDPKYWPEPDKFDPERFSDENKSKIEPYTYLPFGQGPRYCIGTRFALLTAKILIIELIRKFKIEKCTKTPLPMKLSKTSFISKADNGFWIVFKKREK